jgi:geranylgeranyl diphosphate synthase type II
MVSTTSPDEALDALIADGTRRARAHGEPHLRLWRRLAEATEGGKRFRPALVLAAHDSLGGTSPGAAARVGAAVELLHTAFVIHDDVIDGDQVRRGRLNVEGAFTADAASAGAAPLACRHYGATAAILAGDLALTTAVKAVATCGAGPDTTGRLLDLFDDALHATAAGELGDVHLAHGLGTPSLEEVLTMEQRKTSAYSFELPLQAGAALADAAPEVVARLGAAGRLLGLAFQLHDDLLGVFGDPATTGKSTVSDLREGKQTPLIAHARTTDVWPRLEQLLGRELSEGEAEEARSLLQESGSRGFVDELATRHLDGALVSLAELGLPVDVVASTAHLAGTTRSAAA